jgi:hypothetical protein
MSNGYGVLGYVVLRVETFLLGSAIYNQREKSLSMRTNLHNIVQNPDERVAILKPGRQVSSINSHRDENPLSEHSELLSPVFHHRCGCQGRLEEVLRQLGFV